MKLERFIDRFSPRQDGEVFRWNAGCAVWEIGLSPGIEPDAKAFRLGAEAFASELASWGFYDYAVGLPTWFTFEAGDPMLPGLRRAWFGWYVWVYPLKEYR